jgi:hypothetical protein
MSRLEQFWGSHDIDRMFPGGAPVTSVPWEQRGRRKTNQDYDQTRVQAVLLKPHEHELVDVDPRLLRASQPSVTRAGVQYYMGHEYEHTGRTFADHASPGNQYPIVYHREAQRFLLSGHHRAAAALLQGRQFKGYVVEGPWGPRR